MLYGYKYIHLLHEIWQNGIICKVDLHSLLIWDKHCSELLKSQSDFFFSRLPKQQDWEKLIYWWAVVSAPRQEVFDFCLFVFCFETVSPCNSGRPQTHNIPCFSLLRSEIAGVYHPNRWGTWLFNPRHTKQEALSTCFCRKRNWVSKRLLWLACEYSSQSHWPGFKPTLSHSSSSIELAPTSKVGVMWFACRLLVLTMVMVNWIACQATLDQLAVATFPLWVFVSACSHTPRPAERRVVPGGKEVVLDGKSLQSVCLKSKALPPKYLWEWFPFLHESICGNPGRPRYYKITCFHGWWAPITQ